MTRESVHRQERSQVRQPRPCGPQLRARQINQQLFLKRACRAWALDCYFANGRHTHSPVSGSRNWLVQRNHRPQRAQGPMSRLLHTVNKKTKTAQARRQREVTARSGGGQTRGAPRPQHCAGAPVKAQRNPRDRGDRVRPEAGRPSECAQRQRTVQPQSPGSAGGKGQSVGTRRPAETAIQQPDPE